MGARCDEYKNQVVKTKISGLEGVLGRIQKIYQHGQNLLEMATKIHTPSENSFHIAQEDYIGNFIFR